jgi:hypothetical protein
MENPDCSLQPWEAAQCPKLGPAFTLLVEKVTEIDMLLSEWVSEPGLKEELRARISGILFEVNEIPPMLGDLGFDYVGAMQDHLDVLEALKVPENFYVDLNVGVFENTARGPAAGSMKDKNMSKAMPATCGCE